MHIYKTLLILLPFVNLACGLPGAESDKKGFTVKQEWTGKYKLKSGPHEILKTFRKYGKEVPRGILDAVAAKQVGTVTANPENYDRAYFSRVTIGTPAKPFDMIFDTGSWDFWVFSIMQPAGQRGGHDIYMPGKSKTAKLLKGYTFHTFYGDGSSAKGIVYKDKVTIGGATATSQAVEAAQSASISFVKDTFSDGLVGLGFSAFNQVSPVPQKTFFDTIKATLPIPVFAAYLRHAAPGEYDFGHIDTGKFSGPLTYVSVDPSNGYWEFAASGYKIGTTSYVLAMDIIADTGTTLLFLPDAVVNNYWSQVPGAHADPANGGAIVFPCASVATLPDLSLVIGGVAKTIPGNFITFQPTSSSGVECFGGLQSDGGGLSVAGDVFLKSQYVVHDSRGPKIGFGQAV